MKTKTALYACQECGHKFYSLKAAEKASFGDAGCPGCGGSDIDEAPHVTVTTNRHGGEFAKTTVIDAVTGRRS